MTIKYWAFWWQIFLFTKTFFLLCMSDPGVSETPKTNCSIEEYGIQSEDGQLKCIPCTALPTCQHGLGISVACGSIVSKKTHIHCVPCVRGKTFSASSDNKPCQRCQSLDCHPNEKVLGKCEVDKDTSKCSGICEKGFYSNTGRLDNCQPCSLCSKNDSTAVVKKCKDDGIPDGKQCKVPSPTKPSVSTSKLFSTTKTEYKDQKYGVSEMPKKNCSIEEYGIQSEDGQLKCIPCTALPTCQHGLGVSIACGSIVSKKTHIHCVSCVLGKTFSASNDNKPCHRCQSLDCYPNEKVLGKCEIDKDTSNCSGICKKGFYPNTGRLDNCQPCSLCSNTDSTAVVKKCKDDGIPDGKQCKVPLPTKPSVSISKKLFSTTNTECKDQKYGSQGYKLYGHPALFVSMVVIIIFLLAVILAILLWQRKHRKKTYSSVETEEGQTSPPGVENVDSGFGETESVSNQSDQGEVALASAGSQRVYYTKQESNSNIDESEQQDKDDVFDEKLELDTQKTREQRRKLSSSSGNKFHFSFKRQNSNPIPEHQEEKAFLKRRNTFSNFTSLLNTDPKIKGNKEETASLLFSADDSDDDIMSMPPPEAPSSLGESNRIFNSSPMPEHVGNSETTSTDQNDNDILPEVVMLPPSSSSASHKQSGVKVGDLNAETHRKLCNMLSLEIHNKDWRTLAGRMNYTNQQVKEFAIPDKLLDHWGVKDSNDVARLIDLAKGLGRDDIVNLLESPETHPTNF